MNIPILPLLANAKSRRKIMDAFTQRVIIPRNPDACWLWDGARYRNGYGKFSFAHGRHLAAHRFSYAYSRQQEPGALMVCHKCDNPECSNPSHLWLGNNRQNILDAEGKGRHRPPAPAPGEKNARAKLTETNVVMARDLIDRGFSNMQIALIFHVHHSTISAIRRGRTWGERPGTIRQPLESQSSALPIELRPPLPSETQ